jgi:NADP-dependent 3-hydroxy acid dehydrogenase YdfG/Tfp pilus assembly protein PilF
MQNLAANENISHKNIFFIYPNADPNMNTPKIALAYCIDNIKIAEEIDSRISQSTSYRFEHIYCKKSTSEASLSDRLSTHSGPILLLVSDNFLKSAQCMRKGLSLLQKQGSQILPVVAPGYKKDEETEKVEKIPTNFDRVSDIIQYINYWQDQYLDLRRQKRQLEGLDEEKFNAHLKVMREISSEAGEFLRLLRNMDYVYYQEFSDNHFRQLFEFLEDQATWESFQVADREYQAAVAESPSHEEDVEEEVDVSGIPGIELVEEHEEKIQKEEEPEGEEISELGPIDENVHEADELEEEEEEEEPEEEEGEEISEIIERANKYVNAGNWGESIELLAEAVDDHPQHTYLRYRYALTLAQHKDGVPEAMDQLYTLLEIDPNHVEALFLMGELAELRGDFEKAKKYYHRVAEQAPSHPDIHYRLGIVLANHFPEEVNRAAGAFRRAIEENPNNVDAIYQYALLLSESLGQPDKAVAHFREVLDKQENHPFANYDLALLYHRQGETDKAGEYYLKAVKINPELHTPENDQAFGVAEEPTFEKTEETPAPDLESSEPTISEAPEGPTSIEEEAEKEEVKTEGESFTSAAREESISAIPSNGNGEEETGLPEEDPLEALKKNIRKLEEMLRSREGAVASQMQLQRKGGEGKIVMITGATSGIGRATAKEFAENGYRLILTGRRQDRLERLKKIFEDLYGSQVKTLSFDVRNIKEIEQVFQDELDFEWRQIDVLINNAGKAKGLDPIHRGQLAHWEEMIDTNIKGLLYMTRAVTPYMIKRRNGHIINLASIAGKEVYPEGNVYCATKFAVEALTKAMRLDLLQYNIRVSQVSPGHVEHTEFAKVRFDDNEDQAKIYEDFVPLNARDVAEAIYFIASRPRHVNVQDILMTGTQQGSTTAVDRRGRELVNFFIDRIKEK